MLLFTLFFLDASSHLYNRLCPLVGLLVGLLVCNAFVKITESCGFFTEKQQINVFHMITAVGKRIESESDLLSLIKACISCTVSTTMINLFACARTHHKETSPIGAMDICARGLLHQRWCVSGLLALVTIWLLQTCYLRRS